MNTSKKSPSGRLHPPEPALQNVPVRTELGSEIRCVLMGKRFAYAVPANRADSSYSCDRYSYSELRALARYLGELNARGDL